MNPFETHATFPINSIHSIQYTVCSQETFTRFILTCACGRLKVGRSPEVELPPLQQRPIVTLLSDEECVNFKPAYLLLHPLAVRGFIVPEMSHPCWGDVSRALASAHLKGAALKATLVINHFRGPYRSGKFAYDLQQTAAMFCQQL